GPTTERGKAMSKLNAVRHRLHARCWLLPGESREEYDAVFRDCWELWQPVGQFEEMLVDQIAADMWRLRRIDGAESLAWQTPTILMHLHLARALEPDEVEYIKRTYGERHLYLEL